MTFQLDTSGWVRGSALPKTYSRTLRTHVEWSDLDPFTQGYVEALLHEFWLYSGGQAGTYARFDCLAPETLARIMEDCAAFLRAHPPGEDYGAAPVSDGQYFWRDRQEGGVYLDFPPLTVALGGDGKVRFA